MKFNFNIFNCSKKQDSDRILLANSLFYYCCGNDPTPIVAFASLYPLYVYVDNFVAISSDYNDEINILFEHISKYGFQLIEKCTIERTSVWTAKNTTLAQWRCTDGTTFYLLYVQDDARKAFNYIYQDYDAGQQHNYLQPKCVCNLLYENPWNEMDVIEKRSEYIMGHCFNEKYQRIADYKYLGSYSTNEQVPLFRRMYWYVL